VEEKDRYWALASTQIHPSTKIAVIFFARRLTASRAVAGFRHDYTQHARCRTGAYHAKRPKCSAETVAGVRRIGRLLGFSFDEPKEGDAKFQSEGVDVIMDPASVAYMNGSAIDFDDGLHGKGFEIKNPNAQSTCGCGKSFS